MSNEEIAERIVLQHASVRCNVSRILAQCHLRDLAQIAFDSKSPVIEWGNIPASVKEVRLWNIYPPILADTGAVSR